MNYYGPRQRQTDRRWDYTCMNDHIVWPMGYCEGYKEWWIDLKERVGYEARPDEIEKYQTHKDKHHTDGHATAEEACQCYRRYLLDHKTRLGLKWSDSQHRCKVCGEWTQMYAEVDHTPFELCETHNTQEQLELLFETPGEIWSSW